MSRDTWEPTGGREVSVSELAVLWRAALEDGATGLTVSGGEPLEQPAELAALLAAADQARIEAGGGADLLVYTGYEPAEIKGVAAEALRLADAVITGRFDATAPTGLIWRGSANQTLTPRTALGLTRYGPHLDHTPLRAPMQMAVAHGDVRLVGVPRRGDLAALERSLRRRGMTFGCVSWRR
jgi:anaerobic ribonucleoside-triphosphate reductase activating protein